MDIEITLKNYRCFSDEKPARIILRNGFTALAGVNNAGKSSLLKFFYEFRELFKQLAEPSASLLEAMYGNIQPLRLASSILDYDEVYCNTNDRDMEIQIQLLDAEDVNHESHVNNCKKIDLTIIRNRHAWVAKLYVWHQTVVADNRSRNLKLAGTEIRNSENRPVVDIELLVMMFQSISNTLYIGPFRNAINIGSNDSYFDIKVGQSFIQQWREFKTGSVKKANEAIYRLTQDIKHIFEFGVLEINAALDDKTLQVIVNGKSYKLSELGSGLTQFILVLANAAIMQPTYILIDEPELNLHPSLQLDFLTTLGSYARQGVMFATHSIGLARSGANVIYSVRHVDKGSEVRLFEATPRLSEFIGELSFSGYKELGFDRLLLVEGTSDVLTMQQFLRQFRKDHEVLLLPLGGSQLVKDGVEIELQEIKRISTKVYALIDSECASSTAPLDANRQAFVDICKKSEVNCHVLERRATENYFTDQAIKRVKGSKFKALLPYQKLNEAQNGWSKSDNWRIAREMTKEELVQTDLGKFLDSV